jgi:hypothetical protein
VFQALLKASENIACSLPNTFTKQEGAVLILIYKTLLMRCFCPQNIP